MDFISLIICTLCIIVIFTVLSKIYEQYVTRQKFKNFPQIDKEYSIIGSTLKFIKQSPYERTKWLISCMEKTCKEGIFIQWLGPMPAVWMFKPEYLEVPKTKINFLNNLLTENIILYFFCDNLKNVAKYYLLQQCTLIYQKINIVLYYY